MTPKVTLGQMGCLRRFFFFDRLQDFFSKEVSLNRDVKLKLDVPLVQRYPQHRAPQSQLQNWTGDNLPCRRIGIESAQASLHLQ